MVIQSLVLLYLTHPSFTAIGPSADVYVANQYISHLMASIARELLCKIGFAHGHWNHFTMLCWLGPA
jgi:hypothetical protein